jgi:hypothetical protein
MTPFFNLSSFRNLNHYDYVGRYTRRTLPLPGLAAYWNEVVRLDGARKRISDERKRNDDAIKTAQTHVHLLYRTSRLLFVQASIEEGQRNLKAYKHADKFES